MFLKYLLNLWSGIQEQVEWDGFLVCSIIPHALWQHRWHKPCSQSKAGRLCVAHGWMPTDFPCPHGSLGKSCYLWEAQAVPHSLGDGNIVFFGLRLTDALFDLSSVVELMVPLTPLSTTSKLWGSTLGGAGDKELTFFSLMRKWNPKTKEKYFQKYFRKKDTLSHHESLCVTGCRITSPFPSQSQSSLTLRHAMWNSTAWDQIPLAI